MARLGIKDAFAKYGAGQADACTAHRRVLAPNDEDVQMLLFESAEQ